MRAPLHHGRLAFAVDVETDWGTSAIEGIRRVLPRLLELLERHDATATFFVVGELAPSVARVLSPGGVHEVGSHGLTHASLARLTRDEIARELDGSKRSLERQGYEVLGFRAPFLRCPDQLPALLAAAGYSYDASLGSLWPRLAPRPAPALEALPRVRAATLRDGCTPFNLTWLRLLYPLSLALLPARAALFSCHLHELLPGDGGWATLPRALRALHARRCGATAWSLLERVLASYRVVSCRTLLGIPSPAPVAQR